MLVNNKTKQTYHYAYEARGVAPLPKYYEEILAYTKGMPHLGIRGDKYFVLYSRDRLAKAYFEENENTKSAQATYEYFSTEHNRRTYFRAVDKLQVQMTHFMDTIDKVDLMTVSDRELKLLFSKSWNLVGEAFTYFLVTQTYRFHVFEDKLRGELRKRVVASRVDMYMSELAISEKSTQISEEEEAWISLLIAHNGTKLPQHLSIEALEKDQPSFANAVKKHFVKYRTLTLGDGVWAYNINYYIANLRRDFKKSVIELQQRQREIREFPKKVIQRRKQLEQELYLDSQTVDLVEFLAQIGHSRFKQRMEGWMPLVFVNIRLEIELSKRMAPGYFDNNVFLTSDKELEDYIHGTGSITAEDLLKRRGKHDEYLIYLNKGNPEVYFGLAARELFKKLVPYVAYSKVTEVLGTVAMSGKVRGTVSLFLPGDDMLEKLKTIKKNKILITGNTRPAMMPLIRESSGIVTDEGGITSHAAIISRELGIPSIINTKTATKVFKEGDLVELDTEQGIVRKIA